MTKDKNIKKDQEELFFETVKESMLKLCDEHPDSIEYQLFRKKVEKATSFKDLL